MNTEQLNDLLLANLMISVKVALPFLGVLLVAGLLVGLLQAATQVNEPATPFIVKLVAVGALLWAIGGWSSHALKDMLQINMQAISAHPPAVSASAPVAADQHPPQKPMVEPSGAPATSDPAAKAR